MTTRWRLSFGARFPWARSSGSIWALAYRSRRSNAARSRTGGEGVSSSPRTSLTSPSGKSSSATRLPLSVVSPGTGGAPQHRTATVAAHMTEPPAVTGGSVAGSASLGPDQPDGRRRAFDLLDLRDSVLGQVGHVLGWGWKYVADFQRVGSGVVVAPPVQWATGVGHRPWRWVSRSIPLRHDPEVMGSKTHHPFGHVGEPDQRGSERAGARRTQGGKVNVPIGEQRPDHATVERQHQQGVQHGREPARVLRVHCEAVSLVAGGVGRSALVRAVEAPPRARADGWVGRVVRFSVHGVRLSAGVRPGHGGCSQHPSWPPSPGRRSGSRTVGPRADKNRRPNDQGRGKRGRIVGYAQPAA